MRNVRAAAMFASSVTVAAMALTGVVVPADAATPKYRLYVSTHANRSNAHLLSGRTLKGKEYIFVKPGSGANKVYFYLDDVKRRHGAHHSEGNAPYDLEGGVSGSPKSNAKPLVTSNLRNGRHSITIRVDLPNHKRVYSTAYFTVKNVPPKPTKVNPVAGPGKVTITWKSGGGITAGFRIFRSTHASVSLTHPLKTVSRGTTKWVDTKAPPGARYYYVVQAYSAGRGYAASSAVRSAHSVTAAPFSVAWGQSTGGDGEAMLTWTATGGTKINVYRGVGTAAPALASPVKTITGTTKSWLDTSVSNGTTYSYIVQVVNGTKHLETPAAQITPLPAPTGVAADASGGTVTVTWQHSGMGVASFAVLRSPTSDFASVDTSFAVSSSSARSYNDTTAAAGTSYYYWVEAKSAHAGIASSLTSSSQVVRVNAPASLSTESGDSTVSLTWTDGQPGVKNYRIYRGTSPSFATMTPQGTLGSTATSFDDTDLSNGTTLYYVVQAISTTDAIANSAAKAATPIANPILDSPSFDDSDRVTLTWSESNEPPVTEYRIFRGTSSTVQTSGAPYDSVLASTDTWTDTTTTNGTRYFYVVQAYFTGGHAESNTVNVTPNPPNAVQNLLATPDTQKVTLTWDSVDSHATGLEIYRSDTPGQLGDLQAALPINKQKYPDTDSALVDGTVWYYTVRTISAGGFTDVTTGAVTVGAVGP